MKLMRKVALLMLAMLVAFGASAEAFTLRDAVLWQGKKGIGSVTPSADGVSYYTLRKGSQVLKIDFKTGAETVVFDAATARDCDVKHFNGFELSEDESKVLLYTKRMLHAKCVIIDDEFVTTGSTNFDFRSFEHNYEANVFIYSADTNARLKQIFHDDIKHSMQCDISQWLARPTAQRMVDSLVRLFSPIL